MRRSFRSSLAAALLVAVSVVGTAQPVAAGCSINVTYVNHEATVSKVDERKSKSKVPPVFLGVSTWKRLGDKTISIPANGRKTRTYNLDFACDWPKRYKFLLKNGGSSKTVYKPSSDGYTSKIDLTVKIDF